jgi:hypothetical protein
MSHVEIKIEDREDEDAPLALNKISCKYAQRFYNKGPKENVTFIPERKQLVKRRILKLKKDKTIPFKDDDFWWEYDFWWELKGNRTLLEFMLEENLKQKYNNHIPIRAIEELNKEIAAVTTKNGDPNNFFLVPYFAAKCHRKLSVTVPQTRTPIGSLGDDWTRRCFQRDLFRDNPPLIPLDRAINMCVNPFYTEYMISLICSNFYTDGDSIHFVPVEKNSFSTCLTVQKKQKRRKQRQSNTPPTISIQEFFVMDAVEGNPLSKKLLREGAPYKDLDVCLIQVLHSIAVYQRKQISHNDLHSENILIEQILLNTKWNHQELINYAHFQYDLGDAGSLYTPFVPFLIKIIDFGLSCKYSPPPILNRRIMEGSIRTLAALENSEEKHRVVIPPNWYFPAYDVLMFLINFCVVLFPENLLGQQILWVALYFPHIPETGPWNPTTIMGKDIFKITTDPKTFYTDYNSGWTDCITGFNPIHKPPNQIQVVLENNLIERYKGLNALSLLKKCINNKYILKAFTEKPSEGKSCIILGSID